MLTHSFTGPHNGPLVVFLHAVGTTSWMWEPITELLPDYRCMTINLPGHGRSAATPWRSLEQTARQVHQTIASIGHAEPPHLVGLSLGSYVGLTVLTQQPAAYASAVLSGLHAGGMPNRIMMRAASWLLAPLAGRPFFAKKNAAMLGVPSNKVDDYVREAGKTDVASFRRASIDAVDFELPDTLHCVRTNVLVAAGSREHALILASLPTFVKALPHGQSYIAEGLGHGWSLEDRDQFTSIIKRQVEGRSTDQIN